MRQVFLTDKVNPAGVYAVKLYIVGVDREVVVDDQFPYDPYKEQWAFARSKQNELWVLILEKAWAKVHGSYHRTENGTPGEALPVLTGAPVTNKIHQDFRTWEDKLLWKQIVEADK